jgi:hypothetical protein
MKLWLDDTRDPAEHGRIGWVWVKTAAEAIELLKTGEVEQLQLDHDLTVEQTLGNDDHEPTGYDVALFLEENPHLCPVNGTGVHSMNPAGRARMEVALVRAYERRKG